MLRSLHQYPSCFSSSGLRYQLVRLIQVLLCCRLSLKIEPGNSSPRIASSKEDLAGRTIGVGILIYIIYYIIIYHHTFTPCAFSLNDSWINSWIVIFFVSWYMHTWNIMNPLSYPPAAWSCWCFCWRSSLLCSLWRDEVVRRRHWRMTCSWWVECEQRFLHR